MVLGAVEGRGVPDVAIPGGAVFGFQLELCAEVAGVLCVVRDNQEVGVGLQVCDIKLLQRMDGGLQHQHAAVDYEQPEDSRRGAGRERDLQCGGERQTCGVFVVPFGQVEQPNPASDHHLPVHDFEQCKRNGCELQLPVRGVGRDNQHQRKQRRRYSNYSVRRIGSAVFF